LVVPAPGFPTISCRGSSCAKMSRLGGYGIGQLYVANAYGSDFGMEIRSLRNALHSPYEWVDYKTV